MLVPELVLLLWIKTESDEQFCLLPQQLCQFMHPLQKNDLAESKTKHFTGCFSATLPKTFSITREGKGEVKESINKQSSISNPAYVSMTAKICASSLTLCSVDCSPSDAPSCGQGKKLFFWWLRDHSRTCGRFPVIGLQLQPYRLKKWWVLFLWIPDLQ